MLSLVTLSTNETSLTSSSLFPLKASRAWLSILSWRPRWPQNLLSFHHGSWRSWSTHWSRSAGSSIIAWWSWLSVVTFGTSHTIQARLSRHAWRTLISCSSLGSFLSILSWYTRIARAALRSWWPQRTNHLADVSRWPSVSWTSGTPRRTHHSWLSLCPRAPFQSLKARFTKRTFWSRGASTSFNSLRSKGSSQTRSSL